MRSTYRNELQHREKSWQKKDNQMKEKEMRSSARPGSWNRKCLRGLVLRTLWYSVTLCAALASAGLTGCGWKIGPDHVRPKAHAPGRTPLASARSSPTRPAPSANEPPVAQRPPYASASSPPSASPWLGSSSRLLIGHGAIIAHQPPEAAPVTAKSSGILPLPDYSGDFYKRAYLMGDLGGKRSEWAKKGITFDIDYYQYFQSVVHGGVETDSRYGGVIDFNLAIDFDRMGVIPGGLLQMRAVSRYGRSVNGITGSLMPVNTNAVTPTTSEPDEDAFFYLPIINYTQFLSEKVGVFFGKINTYDQVNEFSGGAGKSQFMNMNFAFPISPAVFVPYSVLALGGFYKPTPNLTITSLVATSEDTSNHSGFHFLGDGKFAILKVAYEYQVNSLPGGVINQFGYGWDDDFTEIKGSINIGPGGLTPSSKDHSWWNSSSMWQYLWVEKDEVNKKVDAANGRQDLQGVGFFARYQFADKDTNPIDYLFSIGLGGKGLIPNRDNDTMGLAYNCGKLLDSRLGKIVGVNRTTSVWELYYNVELTPAMHLILDAQVVDGALPNTDTATILGTQLELRF